MIEVDQVVHISLSISSSSFSLNPSMQRFSILTDKSSSTISSLQDSSAGISWYLHFFLTRLQVNLDISFSFRSHSSKIRWRFRPSTVLWSCSTSLVRNLTSNLLLFSNDLWNVTKRLANITFGWRTFDAGSMGASVKLKHLSYCNIPAFE